MPNKDPRTHLHEATLACASRSGFRFSLEEVAAQAGVSRATVYRHFPGGRDELIVEAVNFELAMFFSKVSLAVEADVDLEDKFVTALMVGRHLLDEHEVLHTILREDPEQLLLQLEVALEHVFAGMETYIESLLEHVQVSPGLNRAEAADYLARLYLSYMGQQGRWDLDDPEEVRSLVRQQFLGGVVARGAQQGS